MYRHRPADRREGQDMSDTNPSEQFSGTKDVADSHKFDEAKLAAWMEANVEGYKGPLEVRQFKGGQSNPTYQLVTPGKKVCHAPQAAGQTSAVRSRC
jgi:hypothetical protein